MASASGPCLWLNPFPLAAGILSGWFCSARLGLKSPLNLCGELKTFILPFSHHKGVSRAVLLVLESCLYHCWYQSMLSKICSSASTTALGTCPRLVECRCECSPCCDSLFPCFENKRSLQGICHPLARSSAKVPFPWMQPTSFIPRHTTFFQLRWSPFLCIVSPSQAFPLLTASHHQVLLAPLDLYWLWSCRGRLEESSGAQL